MNKRPYHNDAEDSRWPAFVIVAAIAFVAGAFGGASIACQSATEQLRRQHESYNERVGSLRGLLDSEINQRKEWEKYSHRWEAYGRDVRLWYDEVTVWVNSNCKERICR